MLSGLGYCLPLKHLAMEAGRVYDQPWDAIKHVGCVCDPGYRGPDCSQQECPSIVDPLGKYRTDKVLMYMALTIMCV